MDSHGRGGGYEIIRVDFRTYKKSYLVRAGDRQELSLIDMPKERLQAPISSHKFESEWRLPAGHNRHILNVPQGEKPFKWRGLYSHVLKLIFSRYLDHYLRLCCAGSPCKEARP